MRNYDKITKCELIQEILKYKPKATPYKLWARTKDRLIKILEKLELEAKKNE